MRKADQVRKLEFSGAVDADGHILEPPDTWERYLESNFKARALRIKRKPNGLEYLEIDGRPSKFVRSSIFLMLGGMGATFDQVRPSLEHSYVGNAPFGSMSARERVQRLDMEGLAAAFLYPTLSVLYEMECVDSELVQAYTRAYNRAIVDFCADSDGRLLPVAHLSLCDPDAAALELRRAVKDGCKGAWVGQFVMTRKPHGHPDHNVVFATAEELGVPLAIHPNWEPQWAMPGRYDYKYLKGKTFFVAISEQDAIRYAFASFFQFGVFDRFPRLKLVLLESGAGWISTWLDHADAVYETLIGRSVPLKEKPSYYFRRQCWISADPGERSLPMMVELLGHDKFFWASDFPHPDHRENYIEEVDRLSRRLKPKARAAVLGQNVMRVYGTSMPELRSQRAT